MLKIVYPICCGVDVHKTFVVATIAATDRKNITTYKTQRFSTFSKDLRALAQWLSDYHCLHICMESTGKYWSPVYNILEPSCRITLAHPQVCQSDPGARRPTRKIPSGLPTCLSTIWCRGALSRKKQSGICRRFFAIATN